MGKSHQKGIFRPSPILRHRISSPCLEWPRTESLTRSGNSPASLFVDSKYSSTEKKCEKSGTPSVHFLTSVPLIQWCSALLFDTPSIFISRSLCESVGGGPPAHRHYTHAGFETGIVLLRGCLRQRLPDCRTKVARTFTPTGSRVLSSHVPRELPVNFCCTLSNSDFLISIQMHIIIIKPNKNFATTKRGPGDMIKGEYHPRNPRASQHIPDHYEHRIHYHTAARSEGATPRKMARKNHI